MKNNKHLIIGGASKAGTTAIYYYLKQHPDFFLPEKKELHYFSHLDIGENTGGVGDKYISKEIPNTFKEYLSNFKTSRNDQILVDISPSYLFYDKSAQRIKNEIDDPYVVFILRNPVEKIFSQYLHLLSEGREKLSFSEALDSEKTRKKNKYSDMWLYRESGFYSDKISHFQKTLGKDKVLILYYDDFISSQTDFLNKITYFVGIARQFNFSSVREVNKSGAPRSVILSYLLKPSIFTYFVRRVMPNGLGRIIRKYLRNANSGDKPTIDPALHKLLFSEYKEDITKLEKLVGKKANWS